MRGGFGGDMGPCACSRTVGWEEGWDGATAAAAGSCVPGETMRPGSARERTGEPSGVPPCEGGCGG